jgi:hypothetical protein
MTAGPLAVNGGSTSWTIQIASLMFSSFWGDFHFASP